MDDSRIAGGKALHIAPAQAGQQHGPGLGQQGHQLAQVLLAPLGHGVGEQRQIASAPGGVLHLHVDRPRIAGVLRRCEQ